MCEGIGFLWYPVTILSFGFGCAYVCLKPLISSAFDSALNMLIKHLISLKAFRISQILTPTPLPHSYHYQEIAY